MCVPCQVIIWNKRMGAMLDSASELAKIHLQHGAGWPGDSWGKEVYEVVERACKELEPLLEQAGFGKDHAAPGLGTEVFK